MTKEVAIKALGVILSSYPSSNREGIEKFYKLAVESLSEFPDEILEHLAHPKLGIQTQCTFVPSIAEMRKFCHNEWAYRRRLEALDQPETRRLGGPPPDPEHDAQHRAEMVRKFKELSEELRMSEEKKDASKLMTKEEYQAKLEADLEAKAERAKYEPPPQFSPALKKILNLP